MLKSITPLKWITTFNDGLNVSGISGLIWDEKITSVSSLFVGALLLGGGMN